MAILYWLERLQQEAADAGGELHILNGNHESLNVAGRFRYATPQGMQDFLRWQTVEKIGAGLKVGLPCLTMVAQVCPTSVALQAMGKTDAGVYWRLLWEIASCMSLQHWLALGSKFGRPGPRANV